MAKTRSQTKKESKTHHTNISTLRKKYKLKDLTIKLRKIDVSFRKKKNH